MARKKTEKKAEKIARGIIDKIEYNTVDIDDWAEFWGFTREEYEKFLETAIKALEQEPKTGHWIKTGYIDKVTCSICKRKMWNFWEVNDFNYCPNCGAKMVEPHESEE